MIEKKKERMKERKGENGGTQACHKKPGLLQKKKLRGQINEKSGEKRERWWMDGCFFQLGGVSMDGLGKGKRGKKKRGFASRFFVCLDCWLGGRRGTRRRREECAGVGACFARRGEETCGPWRRERGLVEDKFARFAGLFWFRDGKQVRMGMGR